jgi:hypothetical protein
MSKSKRQFAKRKARERNSRKKVLKKRRILREERSTEEQISNAISASQERVSPIINER